jgi:hypothetical protein
MNFQRERAHDVFDELVPLMEKHYAEIAHYQDIPLDVDRAAYEFAEDAGNLRVFTVRDEDEGAVIGYAVYFVRHNIHYRGSLQAMQDVLFLDPAFRHGLVGAKLIAFADAALQAEGVQVVYHHVKIEHNFGPLLERLGYQLIDLIYGKRLDQ